MSRQHLPTAADSAASPADAATSSAVAADASAGSAVVSLKGESPLLALRDACRAKAGASPTAEGLRASETSLFSSILDSALMLQQDRVTCAVGREGSVGSSEVITPNVGQIDDGDVVDLLTRLLAADELLDGCCGDDWVGDQGGRDSEHTGAANSSSASVAEDNAGGAISSSGNISDLFGFGFGLRGQGGAGSGNGGGGSDEGDGSKPTIYTISEVTDIAKLLPEAPRRVCQYAFRHNDIVWICKQCQADETCVLCNDCFRSSNHEGHEVFFYHAPVPTGGCCDCGDPDAWDSGGFCRKHGLDNLDPLKELPSGLVTAGAKVMDKVKRFLLDTVAIVVRSFNLEDPWRQEDGKIEKLYVMIHQNMQENDEIIKALSEVDSIQEGQARSLGNQLRDEEEAEVMSAPVSHAKRLSGIARALAKRGMLVSVRTDAASARLERMLGVLCWLYEVSTLSDGTCRLVCDMLDVPTLVKLIEANAQLPRDLSRGFHDLYLTLMADQPFKTRIAAAYVHALPAVTDKHTLGVGTADSALYTLSVQFLNRSAFVKELVEEHRLLEILAECLLTTLAPACRPTEGGDGEAGSQGSGFVLDTSHPVLKHRRYTPVMTDLKCVLNIEGVPQRFLKDCFIEWIKILRIVQQMTPQIRQERVHIEHESREWISAFNINISLSSLFEFMLGWLGEPMGEKASIPSGFFSSQPPPLPQATTTAREIATDPGDATPEQQPQEQHQHQHQQEEQMPMPTPSLSPRDLFQATFFAVALFHEAGGRKRDVGRSSLLPAPPPRSEPEPRSQSKASAVAGQRPAEPNAKARGDQGGGGTGEGGVGPNGGEHELLPTYPVGIVRVRPLPDGRTFHTTMYRFLAAMIRESCACEDRVADLRHLKDLMINNPEVTTDMADSSLLVLSFAAEIRSGLWLRNGQCMNDQVLNYSEPNFCKIFRDLDLVLLQFAGLACGANQLLNHVLHRFQIFYWMFDEYNDSDNDTVSSDSVAGAAAAAGATGGAITSSSAGATGLRVDGSGHGGGGTGGGMQQERLTQHRPQQSKMDSHQQLALAEEGLLLMILLVTEIPWAPDKMSPKHRDKSEELPQSVGGGDGGGGSRGGLRPDSRAGRQLRRELVHRLASAPRTHSELQDASNESLESEVLEVILKDIATRREPTSALEPGKFVLKPEVFAAEYDSTFFHQSVQAHQQAGERRPPIKGPTPVAPPPPESHPLFRQLRTDLLKDKTLVRVVGQVLLGCVRKSPGRFGDALLVRGLHLVTIAVHVFSRAYPEGGEGDGDSVGQRQRDVETFCSAMVESAVRPPTRATQQQPQPAQGEAGLRELDADELGGLGVLQGDMGEIDLASLLSGSLVRSEGGLIIAESPFGLGAARPWTTAAAAQTAADSGSSVARDEHGGDPASVLELLLELKETSWSKTDKVISAGVDWILERLAEMSESCRVVITPPPPRDTLHKPASPSCVGNSDSPGGEPQDKSSGGGKGAEPGASTSATGIAATMSSSLSMKERGKAARKRAMDKVQQNAQAFALTMPPDDDVQEGEGEGRGGREHALTDAGDGSSKGGGAVSLSGLGPTKISGGWAVRSEPTECIVCREKTGGALGYVGYGRRSRVLDMRMEQGQTRSGVHLQSCGHALHYACFDEYYATVLQASDAHTSMVLDFDAGEFHCPQCKAVGNLMVPATPTPGEGGPVLEEGKGRAGAEFRKTSEAGDQGSVVVARGGKARRRFVKDGDDMDVSEDEWQLIGKEKDWRETKAALALDRACSQSPTLVDLPPPPPTPSPPPPPPRSRLFSVWGLMSMDVSEDEKEPPSSRSQPHKQQPPQLDPPIRKFLESVYEVAKGNSVVGKMIAPEELFLEGCRALAYSICSAAVVVSPLEAVRRRAGSGATAGNSALDLARLRHLQQVAVVLRTAAGQAGLGDSVRRKLAASLRGEPFEDITDSHQAKQEQERAATKRETGKRKGGGGGTRNDYEKVGELERPLLLTKAIDMLVTAMLLLPGGAVEDAMHCVSAMCLVRVLQVLSCYRYEQRIQADASRRQGVDVKPVVSVSSEEEDVVALFLGSAGTASLAAGDDDRGTESSDVASARVGAAAPFTSAAGAGADASIAGGTLHLAEGKSVPSGASLFTGGRKAAALQVRTFAVSTSADKSHASVSSSSGSTSLDHGKEPAPVVRETGSGGSDGGGRSNLSDRYTSVAAPHVTAFLRAALLVLHLCSHDLAEHKSEGEGQPLAAGLKGRGKGLIGADGTPFPSADDAFEPLCRFFGFPASTEAILSQPGLVEAARRWLLRSSGGKSYGNQLQWDEYSGIIYDFPVPVEIDLVRLPHAYTELHAEVTSRARGRISHPAVCLVCGELLDAHGAGKCTEHAGLCGAGVGVVFLLQECAVLLIHGRRAAYFPSPYVDAYGERQRPSLKGRPLFLDEKRYGVVRGLWIKHLVAHEVVQSRTTSRHVITTNYY